MDKERLQSGKGEGAYNTFELEKDPHSQNWDDDKQLDVWDPTMENKY